MESFATTVLNMVYVAYLCDAFELSCFIYLFECLTRWLPPLLMSPNRYLELECLSAVPHSHSLNAVGSVVSAFVLSIWCNRQLRRTLLQLWSSSPQWRKTVARLEIVGLTILLLFHVIATVDSGLSYAHVNESSSYSKGDSSDNFAETG